MGYQDKILKKRLFAKSLAVLSDFAKSEPALPLNNRRAIVSGLFLGGSLAHHYKEFKVLPSYPLNYQYTRQALIRACLDKMVNQEETQKVKKAICALSSLSVWAQSKPEWTREAFNHFAHQLVPEDFSAETESSTKVMTGLKKDFGNDITLDLVTLSGRSFYKKYKGI